MCTIYYFIFYWIRSWNSQGKMLLCHDETSCWNPSVPIESLWSGVLNSFVWVIFSQEPFCHWFNSLQVLSISAQVKSYIIVDWISKERLDLFINSESPLFLESLNATSWFPLAFTSVLNYSVWPILFFELARTKSSSLSETEVPTYIRYDYLSIINLDKIP